MMMLVLSWFKSKMKSALIAGALIAISLGSMASAHAIEILKGHAVQGVQHHRAEPALHVQRAQLHWRIAAGPRVRKHVARGAAHPHRA